MSFSSFSRLFYIAEWYIGPCETKIGHTSFIHIYQKDVPSHISPSKVFLISSLSCEERNEILSIRSFIDPVFFVVIPTSNSKTLEISPSSLFSPHHLSSNSSYYFYGHPNLLYTYCTPSILQFAHFRFAFHRNAKISLNCGTRLFLFSIWWR